MSCRGCYVTRNPTCMQIYNWGHPGHSSAFVVVVLARQLLQNPTINKRYE